MQHHKIRQLFVRLSCISLTGLLVILSVKWLINAQNTQNANSESKRNAQAQKDLQKDKKRVQKGDDKEKDESLKAHDQETAIRNSLGEKEALAELIVGSVNGKLLSIQPVELSILIQAEMAGVLWKSHPDRAHMALSTALERYVKLLKDDEYQRINAGSAQKKKLKMAILRRIARLDARLIHQLSNAKAPDSIAGNMIVSEWTDEAEAVMAVAMSEVKSNPDRAIDLVNESLSFGLTSLPGFLAELKKVDQGLAEKEAAKYLDKLLNSSVSSIYYLNFQPFVYDRNTSDFIRQHFFKTLAARLRRDLKRRLSKQEYEDNLVALQSVYQNTKGFPEWQAEFSVLLSEYQNIHPQPVPEVPAAKYIDQKEDEPRQGDTKSISDAADRTEKLMNQNKQNEEYRKLALEAAGKADFDLAEKILSRISDSPLRDATRIRVYGVAVKSNAREKKWSVAKSYALRISDPVGRSLILDWLARQISEEEEIGLTAKSVYHDGLLALSSDSPSQKVAQGYLIFAKSFLPERKDESFKAVDMAVSTLNKSGEPDFFSAKSLAVNEINSWAPRQNPMLDVVDTLDLAEMLGSLFYELSKDDATRSHLMAAKLSSAGLNALAELGIARQQLEEVVRLKALVESNQHSKQKN
jgi:hypothetical protein